MGHGAEGRASFRDDVWELYDTTTDWSQAHDLADRHPEKLAALRELFLIEAAKYQVSRWTTASPSGRTRRIAGRLDLLGAAARSTTTGGRDG